MSLSPAIDPTRTFQINGQVCPLQTAPYSVGVGLNQSIIALVFGKKIGIMGWKIQTNGAAVGAIDFKNGSGGAVIIRGMYPPPSAGGLTCDLPVVGSIYASTGTGVALYADTFTTAQHGNIFYITYS